jgi:type IV secretory pathway VirB10-like protein
MTMRAEAARAGKRFKHAVTALSVMSYETGQKHFYKTLAAMTDGQLLIALEAGSIELSISGAAPPAHQPTLPTTRPTGQHPAAPSGNSQDQPAQPAAQPSNPRKEARPLQQQQQASQLDRHQGRGRQQRASKVVKREDSLAQPGTSSQKRPKEDQPAGEAPQAQPPAATPDPTANEKKTRQSRKKAIKRYWARKFWKGE